jgi:hypothetical protein
MASADPPGPSNVLVVPLPNEELELDLDTLGSDTDSVREIAELFGSEGVPLYHFLKILSHYREREQHDAVQLLIDLSLDSEHRCLSSHKLQTLMPCLSSLSQET